MQTKRNIKTKKKTEPKTEKISAKPAKRQSRPVGPLRKEAEALVKKRFGRIEPKAFSAKEMQRLVYDFQTHQIELEIQNEELMHSQIALEEARQRYADLYDFAPLGYFTFDHKGVILEANLAGASLLHMERSRLINKPFIVSVKEGCSVVFFDHINKVLKTGERQICEIELTRKDSTRFVACLESVYSDAGTRVRTAMSDITARKQAEESLKISSAALKKRTNELEALNKELEAFSYVVSHDLQAPLRHMRGFAKVVLEDYGKLLDDAGRDYLHRIMSASERMTELIKALLTMAKLTTADIFENKVNLSSMAEVAAQDLKLSDPARQVKFVIHEGLEARGDVVMLRTVIQNLFENAWKFTSKTKSAIIEFGLAPLQASSQEETIYFVRDNGAGFDMAYADKLFMPFLRLHKDSDFPGLGIGLATVERIVRRHGGTVWADSKPDKGATFYFTLGKTAMIGPALA